ncbi:MAG: M48 family metalloprotease, partial [Nocardioidaceae bacterium]
APTVVLSVLLMTILLGGFAAWRVPAVAGWAAAGWVLLLRPVERVAVRVVFGFRAAAGPDAEWLRWLRAGTEQRSGVSADSFDWYVYADPQPTALAAGRRSIAVTSGFLQLVSCGGLADVQAVAVLLHEVGHHVTGGNRYGLVLRWLCLPWEVVYRLLMRLGGALPFARAGLLLFPALFPIAFVNVAREDAPAEQVVPVLVVLVAVALAVFVHPVADAALRRSTELAADGYVLRLGAGTYLAAALQVMASGGHLNPYGRLRSTHPSTMARRRRLTGSSNPQRRAGSRPDRCHVGVAA